MGTNYYFRYNICGCCNRYDEIHIGKSSGGWQFLFHAVDEVISLKTIDPKSALLNQDESNLRIRSYSQWRSLIDQYVSQYKTASIRDEYGGEISPEDFYTLIDLKKNDKSHFEDINDKYCFLDPEGYNFIDGEFD